MDTVLDIDDTVVTEKSLSRRHEGEKTVRVKEGAILTPTAWDYVRQHRLEVVKGEGQRRTVGSTGGSTEAGSQLVQEVRCEQPDRAYGCEGDEFGSGFAAPDSCASCAIRALQSRRRPNVGCGGCNLHKVGAHEGDGVDKEALVQQIVGLVADRLRG